MKKSMRKLSAIQLKVLEQLRGGKKYCAFILGCSLATLEALTNRGFLCQDGDMLGSMWTPRVSKMFYLRNMREGQGVLRDK